jgi:microcystin-dependent protein
MPIHTHVPGASSVGGSDNPTGNFWGKSSTGKPYVDPANPAANVSMNAGTIQAAQVGGSQPHENMIPYLCINYIISIFGVFPHQ